MSGTEAEWRTEKPDEAGLGWYRPSDERHPNAAPTVEFVPAERPFVIHHSSMTYRWLDDPHFEGMEWRGPIARRTQDGGWELADFRPAGE